MKDAIAIFREIFQETHHCGRLLETPVAATAQERGVRGIIARVCFRRHGIRRGQTEPVNAQRALGRAGMGTLALCDSFKTRISMEFLNAILQGWGRYFWNVSKIQIQEGLYL